MCPSDIIEVIAGKENGFGPGQKVFESARSYPCSIHLLNPNETAAVEIQIKRKGEKWMDYEEGQLIIGTEVACRLKSNQEQSLMIEVFHN